MPTETKGKAVKRSIKIDWWLVAVLLVPIVYWFPELIGKSVFAGIDSSRLNEPFRFFDREAFASGAFPLWNPYLFAGFPHFAESESGVLYPGNFFIHLPGDFFRLYSLEVIAHFIIAGLGFYLWMRLNGFSKAASAFLASTYATTPYLIFHTTAFGFMSSIAWLPWYFLIFDSGIKGAHPVRTGMWLALFLAFMLVSGSVQACFIGVFSLILYAIGKIIAAENSSDRKNAFIRSLALLIPGILAPIIAAVQLIPTSELAGFSERANVHFLEFYKLGTWLNIPRLASLVIFPALTDPSDIQDFGSSLCFLGVVPFAFAVSSLVLWRENRQLAKPLLFAGFITLLLAFGLNLPGFKYLVAIPPFSLFRYPGRFAHASLTFFLPLAAPSIDRLVNRVRFEKADQIGFIASAAFILIVGIIGVFFGGILKPASSVTIFMSVIAIVFFLSIKSRRENSKSFVNSSITLGILLVLSFIIQNIITYPFGRVLVQDRGKFDESLKFFDDINSEFPTDIEIPRFLMANNLELLDPNALNKLGFKAQSDIWDNMAGDASGFEHVTALKGLTPLNLNDWKLILRDTIQAQADQALKAARDSGSVKTSTLITERLYRLLGTDVLLLEGSDWQVPGYEFWRDDLGLPFHKGIAAYRPVEGYVPDAYFVEKIDFEPKLDYASFIRWLGYRVTDISTEAIIETDEDEISDRAMSKGEIIGRTRDFNKLSFSVNVTGHGEGFLVTGESYFPGWRAFADGKEVPIYKTNFLFSGVKVPLGTSTVELRYEPRSLQKGLTSSLIGLILWIFLMAVVLIVHKSGKPTLLHGIEGEIPREP